MHKILLEHTNKPESKPFLKNEVIEYSADAFEKAQEFNWNETDRKEIAEKALERLELLAKNYLDIAYTKSEAEKFVDETIKEMML